MTASRRRILRIVLALLLSMVAAEAASRVFWRVRFGVPLLEPGRILNAYYPELRQLDDVLPRHDDGSYDILILDGSVVHRDWGSIERQLEEELAVRQRRDVRIFNLSHPGHTTRDSLLKYRSLTNVEFDLVVVYHGLNEVRTNNVPSALFRDDYSHYGWYEMVNALEPYHGHAIMALPYSLQTIAIGIRQAVWRGRYVPSQPRREWIAEGANPRSVGPFTENLTALLDLAAQRADQVMLMTYAIHVPSNYSEEAFSAGRLDYALHNMTVEEWGRPEDVVATTAKHNEAVRALAARRHVTLVDQDRLMPRGARYFNDLCHLTAAGSARFVENMIAAMPSPG